MKPVTVLTVLQLSGLTTKQFAERIGVRPSTVRAWISGKNEPHFLSQKTMRFHFKPLFKIAESGND